MTNKKLTRATRGMPIPKLTIKQIEKSMTIRDALQILGKRETDA